MGITKATRGEVLSVDTVRSPGLRTADPMSERIVRSMFRGAEACFANECRDYNPGPRCERVKVGRIRCCRPLPDACGSHGLIAGAEARFSAARSTNPSKEMSP